LNNKQILQAMATPRAQALSQMFHESNHIFLHTIKCSIGTHRVHVSGWCKEIDNPLRVPSLILYKSSGQNPSLKEVQDMLLNYKGVLRVQSIYDTFGELDDYLPASVKTRPDMHSVAERLLPLMEKTYKYYLDEVVYKKSASDIRKFMLVDWFNDSTNYLHW